MNPLKAELQVPAEPPDWASVFAEPRLPLAIDVGCGSGRFMLALARRFPGCNLLGLDIRGPVCPTFTTGATTSTVCLAVTFLGLTSAASCALAPLLSAAAPLAAGGPLSPGFHYPAQCNDI